MKFGFVPLPTVDEILKLDDWISAATTEAETAKRIEVVREKIFGGRDDSDEIEQVKLVIEQAQIHRKLFDAVAATDHSALPGEERKKPTPLYSRSRPAYKRSTREEGLGDDVAKMRAESGGTPFFGEGGAKGPSATGVSSDERSLQQRIGDLIKKAKEKGADEKVSGAAIDKK